MDQRLIEEFSRIAEALERLAPPPQEAVDLESAEAFVWHPSPPHLVPVTKVSRVEKPSDPFHPPCKTRIESLRAPALTPSPAVRVSRLS